MDGWNHETQAFKAALQGAREGAAVNFLRRRFKNGQKVAFLRQRCRAPEKALQK
jgi:hypothetical protein